jgi:hypothetical protein
LPESRQRRWGPFEKLTEVVAFTSEKWPDQNQDVHRAGNGWDVMVLELDDKDKYDPVMKNRPHFAHRVDAWDDEGENVIEHLAGVEDFEVAMATYRAACQRWPNAAITLRQGARVIEDSRRTRLA